MSEKHKQQPVAWARVKHGKIISVSHDKGVAEFLAGFAASELVPLYLQPQPAGAAQTARWLGVNANPKDLIREVFLRNGFTIKAGADDLADYVYEAAHELLQAVPGVQTEPVAYLRTDQLRQVQRMGPMLGEIAASPRVDRVPVYTAPQPAPEVAMLVEALSRCRHQASYSIGGEDALKVQLEKVRDIVSETLHALAAHRKQGGEL